MDDAGAIQEEQESWAMANGVPFDSRARVPIVDLNLRAPLSAAARAAFERGAGSELAGRIRALHSSSALAANFFDYWTHREKAPLLSALGVDSKNADSLEFEARFPTGLGGTPPHLDVAIWLSSGEVISVESKFTEHLRRSTRGKSRFEASYFPESRRLWDERGMPASQTLAEELDGRQHRFEFLDPWQLLKHALGLANGHGRGFRLIYLYYDRSGKRAGQHREELRKFCDIVRGDFPVEPLTYQAVYRRLATSGEADRDYLDYLGARYFPNLSRQ